MCLPVALSLYQRVEQDQFFVLFSGKVMGSSFGHVTEDTRLQVDGLIRESESPASTQDMANHVLVPMVNLLRICTPPQP